MGKKDDNHYKNTLMLSVAASAGIIAVVCIIFVIFRGINRSNESDQAAADAETIISTQTIQFQEMLASEKDKWWDEKHIVGIAYMPDDDEMAMIHNALDYTNWDDYLNARWSAEKSGTEVRLISQTENFSLYERNQNEQRSILIETSEHSWLLAEGIPCTSNRCEQPVIAEADYDNDGENELAVQLYLLHGTGLSVDSLFMVDKASDGQWYLFQYPNAEYAEILQEKCSRVKLGGQYYFKFENRTIAVPQTELKGYPFINYEVGNLVDIECSPEGIFLKAGVGSELRNAPDYDHTLGNRISAEVIYCGDGEWKLENCDYYNELLDEYVEGVMYCYLTGDVQRAETEYHITFQKLEDVVTDCNIIKIFYDSDKLGDSRFEVNIEYTVNGTEGIRSKRLFVQQNDLPEEIEPYGIHPYDMWTIISIF